MEIESADERMQRIVQKAIKIANGTLEPYPCDLCGKGTVRKKGPGVYLCDYCGNGIVADVRLPQNTRAKK